MNILIVEDETRLADAIKEIMLSQRYSADAVYNGADGLDYALIGKYDVIILDVMLPKLNGFEVVKRLRREKNATPVLMLTARDEIPDKVEGLDAGADDYMTKPFSPDELTARVRALARRQGDVVTEELNYDDLTLRISAYDLESGGKSVRLGYKEFEVMRILMSSPGVIVPKEELITKVWGAESDAEDNNVEAYVSFLRKKIAFLGSRVQIGTVRKVGYRLGTKENDET